jgi:hypothetical protein
MRICILYFAIIILVANGSYALAQLARGHTHAVSLPLLLGSICAAIFALLIIRRRLRQAGRPDQRPK